MSTLCCAVTLFGFNIWCPLLQSACPWDCRRQQRKKFDKQLCCACFSFSDFRISLSKRAIANSIPRGSFGLGLSSGFLAHWRPSSESSSKRSCCFAILRPSSNLGRMIRGSLVALAQTGFFAWYTKLEFIAKVPHRKLWGDHSCFLPKLEPAWQSGWQFVQAFSLEVLVDLECFRGDFKATLQFLKAFKRWQKILNRQHLEQVSDSLHLSPSPDLFLPRDRWETEGWFSQVWINYISYVCMYFIQLYGLIS